MSSSVLDALVDALDDVTAATIRLAGDRFDELARQHGAQTPFGGFGHLHTKPERVVVGDDVATLRVVGTPAAVWAWAEKGIRPHTIAVRTRRRVRGRGKPRRGRKGHGGPAAVLGLPNYPVPGPVRHPGFRRLEAWSHAVDDLEHELPELALAALDRAGLR